MPTKATHIMCKYLLKQHMTYCSDYTTEFGVSYYDMFLKWLCVPSKCKQ